MRSYILSIMLGGNLKSWLLGPPTGQMSFGSVTIILLPCQDSGGPGLHLPQRGAGEEQGENFQEAEGGEEEGPGAGCPGRLTSTGGDSRSRSQDAQGGGPERTI